MYLIRLLCFLLGSLCYAQDIAIPLSAARVLDYAAHTLPLHGTLHQSKTFVYVDIDDGYIYNLLEFIKEEGFQIPPYFGTPNKVGAHITVIYPHELTNSPLTPMEEIGQKITFTLQQCRLVHPPKWKEMEQLYIITVESLALDTLREKYGYPKKTHEFHITIGVKPK